jgi:hypothetical protein
LRVICVRYAYAFILSVLCMLADAAAADTGEVGGERSSGLAVASIREDLRDLLASWLDAFRETLAADPRMGVAVAVGVFVALTSFWAVVALWRGREQRERPATATQPCVHPVIDRRTTAAARAKIRVREAPVSRFQDPDLEIKPIEDEVPPRLQPPRANAPQPAGVLLPKHEGLQPTGPGMRPTPSPSPAPPPPVVHRALESTAVGEPTRSDRDPDRDLPVPWLPDPMGSEGRISQCFAFLAEGRFEEAVGVTRQGLNGHPDASRVLGQLSRVASLLGREDDAIELATKAYSTDRSDECLKRLLQLRSAAHRFGARSGERLRLAVAHHPEEPVYLRALGIFEALHGDRAAARRLLRAALRHETTQETRGAITRELLQLEDSGLEGR